jgi:hypothetical protein
MQRVGCQFGAQAALRVKRFKLHKTRDILGRSQKMGIGRSGLFLRAEHGPLSRRVKLPRNGLRTLHQRSAFIGAFEAGQMQKAIALPCNKLAVAEREWQDRHVRQHRKL